MPLVTKGMHKLSPMLIEADSIKEATHGCRLIVEPVWRKTERFGAFIESMAGIVRREIRLLPALVIDLPVAALADVTKSGYTSRIWLDAEVEAVSDVTAVTPDGGEFREWDYTGQGVTVAVLDTGIYPHDDLSIPENRILAWNDIINSKTSPYDDHGHGTHTAGVIAGNGFSADGKHKGMAPDARLVGVKVLDHEGKGRISDIISAIEWCLENRPLFNIRVMNLSITTVIQGNIYVDPLQRAIGKAWNQGIVVCAAASNNGLTCGLSGYSCYNPQMITIGLLDNQQTITVNDNRLRRPASSDSSANYMSNHVKPDLVAPGSKITTLQAGGGYESFTGGSMATALVSGGVAQILQKWPNLTPNRVKRLLLKNTDDLGLGVALQGAGVFNLNNILYKSKKRNPNYALSVPNPNQNLLRMMLSLLGPNSLAGESKGNGAALQTLLALLANLNRR